VRAPAPRALAAMGDVLDGSYTSVTRSPACAL
jgi:hypothetical protein